MLPVTNLLAESPLERATIKPFTHTLVEHGLGLLSAKTLQTIQVNLGKMCNQTCHHCHVDAGPLRTEIMTQETMDLLIEAIRQTPEISTIDITGGAPEMNPHFEHLVTECKKLGRHMIDRCNLTVFFVRGKNHLPRFLADHQVEIIASLPCYLGQNVDQQRGQGVFTRSIAALRQLNGLGYGLPGSSLILNLVYNPVGPTLPPSQEELEQDYKEELARRFGVSFNRLYTMTNMPISRFLTELLERGQTEQYLDLLVNNFNPSAVDGLMCRHLVSISWDGRLFDCDFNQMLDVPVSPCDSQTINAFDLRTLVQRRIMTGQHCYGCTAGTGSSCGGAIT